MGRAQLVRQLGAASAGIDSAGKAAKFVFVGQQSAGVVGRVGAVPSGQTSFLGEGRLKGRRQIVGCSAKRRLHWHDGLTPKVRVYPFPHVRFVGRVVLTSISRLAPMH